MHRALILAALALAISLPVAAQQTGDAMRDYTINGIGAGGSSPIPNQTLTPGILNQSYSTQDPSMPLVWVTGSIQIGALVTPSNSVDLNPASFSFLAVGGDPSSFLNQLFWTNLTGQWSLNGAVGPVSPGSTIAMVMAHPSFQAPEGWLVSQVQQLSFVQDGNLAPGSGATCFPGGTAQPLTDDSSIQVPLGFSFTYYGVQYSNCFIGSNGYITFGVGDSSLGESVSGLLSGAPRISMWWDDLNPTNGGSVNFYTDNLGFAEVCFNQVPEFSATGANSFLCQMTNAGAILMDFGAMSSLDGLTGLSPGNNLDPTGTPINLSIANNVITPGAAAFELFNSTTSVNDLTGFSVTWILDGSGNPILQL